MDSFAVAIGSGLVSAGKDTRVLFNYLSSILARTRFNLIGIRLAVAILFHLDWFVYLYNNTQVNPEAS